MEKEYHACEECVRNCQLAHWDKMDLSSSVARFFKVLIGDDFDKVLLLPPKFTATVTDLVDQETMLEDVYGQRWKVMLSSSSDGLAFRRGWHDFALHHNLKQGDFLVFNYIKRSHFVVLIFGKNCCEKNYDRNCLPSKRARIKETAFSQGNPSEKINMKAMYRQSLSTSDASGSKSQPAAKNSTPYSGGGNTKSPCLDSSFSMMLERDSGPSPGEDRTCLYDLSSFEVHESKQAGGSKKGIDVEEGTSNQAHTSMRSQAEANKDFIGTEDFNSMVFTNETDIGTIEKEKILEFDRTPECEKEPPGNLSNSIPLGLSCGEPGRKGDSKNSDRTPECEKEPPGNLSNSIPLGLSCGEPGRKGDNKNSEFTNDRTLECEKARLAKLSNGVPLDPSCAEPGSKGDGMSNVDIKLQSADRSNGNYSNDWSSPYDDEGASLMNSEQEFTGASLMERRQEFTGDIKKMVNGEQQETREIAHGCAKRKRGLKPITVKESGTSSRAPYVRRQMKPEPLDVPSSYMPTVSCLAVTDGQHYLELPSKLPAIRFRKGGLERKAIVLKDQERRLWPALYYKKSGLHVLTSGWDKVNQENGIQAGDRYVFKVEDPIEYIYRIDVLHQ